MATTPAPLSTPLSTPGDFEDMAAFVQPQEVPVEVFLQNMRGMQQHYATVPGVLRNMARVYALPLQLVHPPIDAAIPQRATLVLPGNNVRPVVEGANAVDNAIQRIHAETLAWVRGHAEALMSAAEQADQTKSTADWAQKMNACGTKTRCRHGPISISSTPA
jgi:hypothetical protein